VEFLKKFEYLSVLDIVITIDGNQAPDFEPVLSLLDLCKIKVFVIFKGPEILGAPQEHLLKMYGILSSKS